MSVSKEKRQKGTAVCDQKKDEKVVKVEIKKSQTPKKKVFKKRIDKDCCS